MVGTDAAFGACSLVIVDTCQRRLPISVQLSEWEKHDGGWRGPGSAPGGTGGLGEGHGRRWAHLLPCHWASPRRGGTGADPGGTGMAARGGCRRDVVQGLETSCHEQVEEGGGREGWELGVVWF